MPCRVHIFIRNEILAIQIFVEKCTWLVLAWLAIRAAADVIICTTVAVLLRARRTGFKQYDYSFVPLTLLMFS